MNKPSPETWRDISATWRALLWSWSSWQKVRVGSAIVIVLCIPVVALGPSWVAMIDCVIIGAMLATIYFAGSFIKLQAAFDEMSAGFKAVSEINTQLINSHLGNVKKPPLEPTDAHKLH